jgi:hypothetical protein
VPAVGAFERRARAVRRVLRRYPLLEPAVSCLGKLLWRWNLGRTAQRRDGLAALPDRIEIDPRAVLRSLELEPPDLPGGEPSRGGAQVRAGSWDRAASPWPANGGGGGRPIERPADEPPPDEVAVAFDRLGRPCVVAGRRRLAAAREAGLPAVPATVVLRHERWARLAGEVRAYAISRGGTAYQPYLHPDLANVPSDQGHERFELLLSALPVRSGTLLDLGANSGYFSHRFEEAGFDCVAVERSEKEAHFLTALRDAAGRRFTVLKGSFTEVELPPRPDVVLALNVFHHFLKTEATYRQLQSFLGRLQAERMLFQAHLPDDPQMRTAAHDMAPAEFVEWVRAEGGFGGVRRLGAAADDRPIFLLSRPG